MTALSCFVLSAVLGLVGQAAFAQASQDPPPVVDPPPQNVMIMAQVQQEEFISKKYISIMLNMQHAQKIQTAGMMFHQGLVAEMKEAQRRDQEEYSEDYDFEEQNGDSYDPDMAFKLNLLAAYNLYGAINIKNLQTIMSASDIHTEFFMDRFMSLQTMAAGQQLPPLVYSLAYIKTYSTFLKTMRLSYALQTIQHFRTWLDDAMEIELLTLAGDDATVDFFLDHIVSSRMWAMSAYQSYAQLDLTVFYIDLYFEAMMAQVAGGGSFGSFGGPPTQTPTFLEVEAEAEPAQTQSGFFPAMGYGYNPMLYMKFYKFYMTLAQYQGAASGIHWAYAEQMLVNPSESQTEDQDQQIAQMRDSSRAGFAQSLMQMGQFEMLTSSLEVIGIYASFFAPAMVPVPPPQPSPQPTPTPVANA